MGDVVVEVNRAVQPQALAGLRAAVGWARQEADYPAAFAGYWATVSGHDRRGELVAWCAVLSDGVRHAVLLDVIVHPQWQGRGVGRELIETALTHIRAHGITLVHVDYLPDVRGFYERCGFRTGLGGILESRVP